VVSAIENYGSGHRRPLRPALTEANDRPDRSSHEGLSVIATSSLLTRHSDMQVAATCSEATGNFTPLSPTPSCTPANPTADSSDYGTFTGYIGLAGLDLEPSSKAFCRFWQRDCQFERGQPAPNGALAPAGGIKGGNCSTHSLECR
jgi:hypothetical protein